jgi:hypothetical protein
MSIANKGEIYMKLIKYLLIVICFSLAFSACSKDDGVVFTAIVLENADSLIVAPQKDSNEYSSSDKIVVHTNDATIYNNDGEKISLSSIITGQTLEITYNGTIAESYPAQIWASKIKVNK